MYWPERYLHSTFLIYRIIQMWFVMISSRYQKSHATNTKSGNYLTNYYYTQGLLKRTKNNTHILPLCKCCVSYYTGAPKKQSQDIKKLFMSSSIVDHEHGHLFRTQAGHFHQMLPLLFTELRASMILVPLNQDGPNGLREPVV